MPKTETFIEELKRKQQEGNLKPSQIKEKELKFRPPLPPKAEPKDNLPDNAPKKVAKDFNYKTWLLLIGAMVLTIYLLKDSK